MGWLPWLVRARWRRMPMFCLMSNVIISAGDGDEDMHDLANGSFPNVKSAVDVDSPSGRSGGASRWLVASILKFSTN